MILSLDLMILGIVTVFYVIVITVQAIIFITKYPKFKNKTFLFVGISSFGLATAWAGVAMNFICIVFFNVTPSMELYFLVHGAYLPISNYAWVLAALSLSEKKSYKRNRLQLLREFFICYLK